MEEICNNKQKIADYLKENYSQRGEKTFGRPVMLQICRVAITNCVGPAHVTDESAGNLLELLVSSGYLAKDNNGGFKTERYRFLRAKTSSRI